MSQTEKILYQQSVRARELSKNKDAAQRILENLRASLTRNTVSYTQVTSYTSYVQLRTS